MMEPVKHVRKAWGNEYWLVNNELYCGKLLGMVGGWVCSLHRHLIKDETFILQTGNGYLQIGMTLHYLEKDIAYRIPAGTWHRFWTTSGMSMLEISTTHSDLDVDRLTESHRFNGKEPQPIQLSVITLHK